jgi:cytochrome c biogenesis protein CcmG/thiol:disulfide interchange protein DsbE
MAILRRGAAALALVALASACGAQGARPAASPPPVLPAGYSLYDAGKLGFRFGLPPEWRRNGDQAPDGAEFSDPSKQVTLLAHVERARSTDLTAATGAVLFDLTGGGGATGGTEMVSTLGGQPARWVRGGFASAGPGQEIEAVVALRAGNAYVLALAGPSASLAADEAVFDEMRASFQLTGSPALPDQVALNGPAPRFEELDRIQGPVVLNFFASWCGPCHEEMPLLASRARASHGRFTVLGMDTQDDASKVPAFLKGLGITFPIGYDRDGHLSQRYLLPGVPGTFFLDSSHVVRDMDYGPLTDATLTAGLKSVGVSS